MLGTMPLCPGGRLVRGRAVEWGTTGDGRGVEGDRTEFDVVDGRFVGWKAEPEFFVVEDQNGATRLVKNALGGISFAAS